MKTFLLWGAVAGLLLTGSPVMAHDDVQVTATADSNAAVTSVDATVAADKEAPSQFGLMWRGLRERISLFTTVNSVKKAQKQLQFAEERMRIAETFAAKSDDPKAQERAEKMTAKATEYLQKIEKKKDTLIPKDVRAHLQEVKERLDARKEDAAAFEAKHQALVERVLNGDDSAQAELESLEKERKAALQERVDAARELQGMVKEKKEEVLKKAKAGDEQAKKEVKMIEKVRGETDGAMKERHEKLLNEAKRLKEVSVQHTLDVEARVKAMEDGSQ